MQALHLVKEVQIIKTSVKDAAIFFSTLESRGLCFEEVSCDTFVFVSSEPKLLNDSSAGTVNHF